MRKTGDNNPLDASVRNDLSAIGLSREEMAAVEGWRDANGLADTGEAIRSLVRLGLLSDLARVHEFVSRLRDQTCAGVEDSHPEPPQWRSDRAAGSIQ